MYAKLIVANWKENPGTERVALALFSAVARAKRGTGVHVVVCPPTVYLEGIAKKYRALKSKSRLALGAQDVFWEEIGAYTGEAGPLMLKQFGIRYVIIGHSEQRKFAHESDEEINKKIHAALAIGLTPILCVGEPLAVRKKSIAAAKQFVKNQLIKDLKGVITRYPIPDTRYPDLVIAYEPLWAIGTGRNADPKEAATMSCHIKTLLPPTSYLLPPRVLYGGSVNARNLAEYISRPEIDGALVGGASIEPKEFVNMIELL